MNSENKKIFYKYYKVYNIHKKKILVLHLCLFKAPSYQWNHQRTLSFDDIAKEVLLLWRPTSLITHTGLSKTAYKQGWRITSGKNN